MVFPQTLIDVGRQALAILAPPPDLTVSEWADTYRQLSPEASAEPGQWRTNRFPPLRDILDAFCEKGIDTVVGMMCTQVSKTETILNVMGYFAHQDPSPMLIIQPTLDLAETFSKDRIAPMVRDTKALSEIIADSKSRDSGNTLLHKKFPGGQWALGGANSPVGLRSRPIRVLLCDEVDGYPASAGTEGDPIMLADERTSNFHNRIRGYFSTPTIKGMSRIESEYEKSDQRHCYLPCPHCGFMQMLEWERIVYDDDKPETASYTCAGCGALIDESHKSWMLERYDWRAHSKSRGVAGFHLNKLYSPWVKWATVVAKYLDSRGKPEEEKVWRNTALGLPHEDRDGELLVADVLQSRRESWRENLLPAETVMLTAGVDSQDDRLEAVLLGWATTGQLMISARRVFEGSPSFPQVWATLDAWLLEERQTETGGYLKIRATCVDSGGHHTQQAYNFCTARAGRDVYAIKGADGPIPAWPDRSSTSRKYRGHKVWRIGVDTIKDILRARLSLTEGDGRIRFAADLSPEFFAQLTVERRVLKYDNRGRPKRVWVKPPGARNETFDCTVYGWAALEALRKLKRVNLARLSPPTPREPKSEAPQPRVRKVVKRVFGKSA